MNNFTCFRTIADHFNFKTKSNCKLLFIALILSFYHGFTQNANHGEIIYGQKMHDTTIINVKKIPDNVLGTIKNKILSLKENSERINYKLRFDDSLSVFKAEKIMDIDNQESINNTILAADANGDWYTNLESNVSVRSFKFLDQKILIKYTKVEDWIVTSERKNINGYNCFKAIRKKSLDNGKEIEVIAWFTNEIPLNLGPKNYFGLPGLIIELIENKFTFYLKNIKFKSSKKNIETPNDGKVLSEIEFKDYVKNAMKKKWDY